SAASNVSSAKAAATPAGRPATPRVTFPLMLPLRVMVTSSVVDSPRMRVWDADERVTFKPGAGVHDARNSATAASDPSADKRCIDPDSLRARTHVRAFSVTVGTPSRALRERHHSV